MGPEHSGELRVGVPAPQLCSRRRLEREHLHVRCQYWYRVEHDCQHLSVRHFMRWRRRVSLRRIEHAPDVPDDAPPGAEHSTGPLRKRRRRPCLSPFSPVCVFAQWGVRRDGPCRRIRGACLCFASHAGPMRQLLRARVRPHVPTSSAPPTLRPQFLHADP
jgi:hypothetical protein